MDSQKEFDEYMKNFRCLSLDEKQDLILDQFKILVSYVSQMCKSVNSKENILWDKSLKMVRTQDDFADAIITYLNSVQMTLNNYNIALSDFTDSLM